MLTFFKRHQRKHRVRELSAEEFQRLEAKHTVVNDYYVKYGLPL